MFRRGSDSLPAGRAVQPPPCGAKRRPLESAGRHLGADGGAEDDCGHVGRGAATLTSLEGFCYPNTALACASGSRSTAIIMGSHSPALVHRHVLACATSWGGSPKSWCGPRLDELNRHGKYSADDLYGAQLPWYPNDPAAGHPRHEHRRQPGYGDRSAQPECQSPRPVAHPDRITDSHHNCRV